MYGTGNAKEIRTNEFEQFSPHGFIFGKERRTGQWLAKPETKDGHILIFGGSGSGKSSCLVIPSIMCWRNRIFAIDIKGELREKADRGTIKVFNPLDKTACGYDPFYILQTSKNIVSDIEQIAMAIIPLSASEQATDPTWVESARSLLAGGLIHYHYQGVNFIEAVRRIQVKPIVELVDELMESNAPKIDVYRKPLADLISGKATKTLAGVSFQISNYLKDFVIDDDIINALSQEENNILKPTDLENGYDIFLQIPQSKLKRWGKILGLITAQFFTHFQERAEGNEKPILFLLDEFASLGTMDGLVEAMATLRSKKITMALICQDRSQLVENYGRNNAKTIFNNCYYIAILNSADPDDQRDFSALVGVQPVLKETRSSSKTSSDNPIGRIEEDKGWFGPGYKAYTTVKSKGESDSISYTYEDKPIIQPSEFFNLKDIVLLTPDGYLRVQKTPYYDNDIMRELMPRPKTPEEIAQEEEQERERLERQKRLKIKKEEEEKQQRKEQTRNALLFFGGLLLLCVIYSVFYR